MAIPRRPVARFRGLAVLGLTLIGLTATLAACASGAATARPTAGRRASLALARAYKAFFASNGSSAAAKQAVAAASKRVSAFCPGAAS